ncbi:hypothetical protein [Hoylesella shahii]|jgi:hypothetical protein|uniref:hypothetical protein n=1 Tax=Hoylesella shahii TaxID=228603 RepID=UPI002059F51E|nr:hypothetical protein [Hoylesella shahii]DAV47266.1 MAG TPA: hypothetical protein [Caudoviricetes sp.]
MNIENVHYAKNFIDEFIRVERIEYCLRENFKITIQIDGQEIKLFDHQMESVRRALLKEHRIMKKSLCEELKDM